MRHLEVRQDRTPAAAGRRENRGGRACVRWSRYASCMVREDAYQSLPRNDLWRVAPETRRDMKRAGAQCHARRESGINELRSVIRCRRSLNRSRIALLQERNFRQAPLQSFEVESARAKFLQCVGALFPARRSPGLVAMGAAELGVEPFDERPVVDRPPAAAGLCRRRRRRPCRYSTSMHQRVGRLVETGHLLNQLPQLLEVVRGWAEHPSLLLLGDPFAVGFSRQRTPPATRCTRTLAGAPRRATCLRTAAGLPLSGHLPCRQGTFGGLLQSRRLLPAL